MILPARIVLGVLLTAAAGCQPADPAAGTGKTTALTEQVSQLEAENRLLRQTLAQRQEQIETLQGLGGPKRLGKIPHVESIEIGRYTGGVDLDKQPGDEAVDVFVTPLDRQRDSIKAAGSLVVEIFDLARKQDHLVVRCTWNVDELSKQWKSGFMSGFYRVRCPLPKDRPLEHPDLTVRASFTDYLTGKKFTAQRTAKVALVPK